MKTSIFVKISCSISVFN